MEDIKHVNILLEIRQKIAPLQFLLIFRSQMFSQTPLSMKISAKLLTLKLTSTFQSISQIIMA